MKNKLRAILQWFSPGFRYRKISYSQYGEDILIRNLFIEYCNIFNPSYLDLGAHSPFHLSNSALFYKLGSTGVNIEANPILFKAFEKYRKKDINLNIGVAPSSHEALQFYIMEQPELNTFVKSQADKLAEQGFPIKEVIKVRCLSLKDIITSYCDNIFPDFLSIDVEGLDEEILNSYDFSLTKPKIICVENLEMDDNNKLFKKQGIRDILKRNGYALVADTYLNDIFIDQKYISYK